jgi:hypothetical protein
VSLTAVRFIPPEIDRFNDWTVPAFIKMHFQSLMSGVRIQWRDSVQVVGVSLRTG